MAGSGHAAVITDSLVMQRDLQPQQAGQDATKNQLTFAVTGNQPGYYAQGVGERTAVLPQGWRDRVVRIENSNTRGVAGLCLEVHDLAISKHVAGRQKDLEFTRELARHKMTDSRTLLARLRDTEIRKELRTLIEARIRADAADRKWK